MKKFFIIFFLAVVLLFNDFSAYSQSSNNPQLVTLKGTFGLGEGDVTSTIYVGKDAYDIYFSDGMETKQREWIEKLMNMCSASQKKICEIVCLVQKAPKDDQFYGYITDIKSIKPILTSSTLVEQHSGPVVFGLYLGMPYNEAAKILTNEGYEIRRGKIDDEARILDPSAPYEYYLFKNGYIVGNIETRPEKGNLCGFSLPISLFEIKNYDQVNFAKQFLDHYKVPYTPDMFSMGAGKLLILTNRELGYEIAFPISKAYSLYIKEIQKNSDVKFK